MPTSTTSNVHVPTSAENRISFRDLMPSPSLSLQYLQTLLKRCPTWRLSWTSLKLQVPPLRDLLTQEPKHVRMWILKEGSDS